jgi:hypothetical protein
VTSTFRLPNGLFVCAAANWCRNSGAAAINPKLASPIPLALRKYRLSIKLPHRIMHSSCKIAAGKELDDSRWQMVSFIFSI